MPPEVKSVLVLSTLTPVPWVTPSYPCITEYIRAEKTALLDLKPIVFVLARLLEITFILSCCVIAPLAAV